MIVKFKLFEKSNLTIGDYGKYVKYNRNFGKFTNNSNKKETTIGEIIDINDFHNKFTGKLEPGVTFIAKYYYTDDNITEIIDVTKNQVMNKPTHYTANSIKPLSNKEKKYFLSQKYNI